MRLPAPLAILLAATLTPALADEADELVATATALEAQLDPRGALAAFRTAHTLRPDDPVILQKIAKQLSDAAFIEPDIAARRRLAEEALPYAQRAQALAPGSAENALSVAIVYGRLAAHADGSQRVEYARLIHRHATLALALDPGYAWAHHVLGEWHVAVADLGGTRRLVASLLFGGLPKASRTTGLQHLERAVDLEPDAVAHRVSLGLALLGEHGRVDEAHTHLKRALELPDRAIHDPLVRARARAALQP